jgi:hypothetical protein
MKVSGSHGGEYEGYSLLDIAPCSLVKGHRCFRGALDDGGSTHRRNIGLRKETTRRCISYSCYLHIDRHENLKAQKFLFSTWVYI